MMRFILFKHMNYLCLSLSLLSFCLRAQPVNSYFEKIRDNEAALTAFFMAMPKGGDLHYHYHGSVYAETFVDIAIRNNFYLNMLTLDLADKKPGDTSHWTTFSHLKEEHLLDDYTQRLLQKWSAKDFNNVDYPSHRQFFESFGHFSLASRRSFNEGLLEIKTRAKGQHITYIEMMLDIIDCPTNFTDLYSLDKELRHHQALRNTSSTSQLLDSLYNLIQKRNMISNVINYNDELATLHSSLAIDDSTYTQRYQAFVLRFQQPVELFKNLILAFESANRSPLVVGVNIVSPEHGEVSMNDYWLHMQMFNYCHKKFPAVKYSLHAGELTLGLVRPEELTWHIQAAVYEGKANRIGHGVDLAYEKDCYSLLAYMRKNIIPVEINLYSNEFILKVKEGRHPISLYHAFHVPIVISSDDEGVLRTNLTEQYVLLAKRYKQISYTDIKQFVYNSIQYSFIKEIALKQKLKADLDVAFKNFERSITALAITR